MTGYAQNYARSHSASRSERGLVFGESFIVKPDRDESGCLGREIISQANGRLISCVQGWPEMC